MDDPVTAPVVPRPRYVVIQELTTRLSAECADSFGGATYVDRALEIVSTGGDCVAAVVADFTPKAGGLRMRVVSRPSRPPQTP